MIKQSSKIIKTLFLIIFIFDLSASIFLIGPLSASAAETKPNIKIDVGANFSAVAPCPTDSSKLCINWISEYIVAIYKYAIGVVGIIATVVLMIGGLVWLTSGGNQTRVGEAKAWIGASLTGLLLTLGSFMILATVNPKLTQFEPIKIAVPPKENPNTNNIDEGCCLLCVGASCSCSRTKESNCDLTKNTKNKWLGLDATACSSACTESFWKNNFKDQIEKTCLKTGESCGDGGAYNAITKNDLCCSGDCIWGMLNNTCK